MLNIHKTVIVDKKFEQKSKYLIIIKKGHIQRNIYHSITFKKLTSLQHTTFECRIFSLLGGLQKCVLLLKVMQPEWNIQVF